MNFDLMRLPRFNTLRAQRVSERPLAEGDIGTILVLPVFVGLTIYLDHL